MDGLYARGKKVMLASKSSDDSVLVAWANTGRRVLLKVDELYGEDWGRAGWRPGLVRVARKRSGMTQEQFAKVTGIKQPRLSKIEMAMTEPNASQLFAIAKAAQWSVDDFFVPYYTPDEEESWPDLEPKS